MYLRKAHDYIIGAPITGFHFTGTTVPEDRNRGFHFTGFTVSRDRNTHSISKYRERFMGKTVGQIEKMLRKRGYQTVIRKSKHATSRAKVIVIGNSGNDRNITQVQVSPGSKRHGNVPYVKISTNDIGIHKIIDSTREQYKSDGNESAKLWFRRDKCVSD